MYQAKADIPSLKSQIWLDIVDVLIKSFDKASHFPLMHFLRSSSQEKNSP